MTLKECAHTSIKKDRLGGLCYRGGHAHAGKEICLLQTTHCVGIYPKQGFDRLRLEEGSNLDFAGRVIFSFKCCRFSTLDINESDAAEETPPSKFKSVALIIDSSRTGKCNSSNRTSSDDEMRGGMNLGR